MDYTLKDYKPAVKDNKGNTLPAEGICKTCGTFVMLDQYENFCTGCDASYGKDGKRFMPKEKWYENLEEDWGITKWNA